jgi:peptidoglycan-N-acetylmuramic acid deacetylase
VIYLTFDVGYENGNVNKILDVMKDEGVVGSFFILGNVISRNPELVLRMANEGHIVCNHTLNHPNLVGKSEEIFKNEVLGLENEYRKLTGKQIAKFFRPPEGTFDRQMLERAQSLGYKTVFWSFAYADWDNNRQMNEEVALKKILDNVHNGEIMLLHPTGETNAKIMRRLIKELKAQGYTFATLDKIK